MITKIPFIFQVRPNPQPKPDVPVLSTTLDVSTKQTILESTTKHLESTTLPKLWETTTRMMAENILEKPSGFRPTEVIIK